MISARDKCSRRARVKYALLCDFSWFLSPTLSELLFLVEENTEMTNEVTSQASAIAKIRGTNVPGSDRQQWW